MTLYIMYDILIFELSFF